VSSRQESLAKEDLETYNESKMKKLIFLLLVVCLGGLGIWYLKGRPSLPSPITSFEECVAAGFPVMESYPGQCRANGQTFVEDVGEISKQPTLDETIRVDNPHPDQLISSPLTISGQARGTWFFEASAPVQLVDETGTVLAESSIEAQGEWMTEAFVEFSGQLVFDSGQSKAGTLIVQNDNPSDIPENSRALQIPVRFE
jgi:hypothetical protein